MERGEGEEKTAVAQHAPRGRAGRLVGCARALTPSCRAAAWSWPSPGPLSWLRAPSAA